MWINIWSTQPEKGKTVRSLKIKIKKWLLKIHKTFLPFILFLRSWCNDDNSYNNNDKYKCWKKKTKDCSNIDCETPMEIQDPQSEFTPKPESYPNPSSSSTNVAACPSSLYSAFIRNGSHHRRAHSEMSFCLPEDMTTATMMTTTDPMGGGSSTTSLDEIGSEDDLFSTYIDVDKLTGGGGNGEDQGGPTTSFKGRHNRHRYSNSVDGHGEILDAKKAMPPDKLAELWSVDPKRAKRCSSNLNNCNLFKIINI